MASTAPHPMEKLFINMVKKLSVEVNQQHDDPAKHALLREKLQQHLDKAKRLSMRTYEGEAHNAYAIFNILTDGEREITLHHLEQARQCAQETDNLELQLSVLNNLGSTKNTAYEFDEARALYERIIEISQSQPKLPLTFLFAAINLVQSELRSGNWEQADARLQQLYANAAEVTVTPATRHSYGRVMYYVRLEESRLRLAQGQLDKAASAMQLARELGQQLGTSDGVDTMQQLEATQQLLSENDVEAFEAWYSDASMDDSLGLIDGSALVCTLATHDYHDLATRVGQHVLTLAPDDGVRARVQGDLQAAGVRDL